MDASALSQLMAPHECPAMILFSIRARAPGRMSIPYRLLPAITLSVIRATLLPQTMPVGELLQMTLPLIVFDPTVAAPLMSYEAIPIMRVLRMMLLSIFVLGPPSMATSSAKT